MTHTFNTIVNKSESEALKDMIFKRAQERAKNYSDDLQNDVMDLARESFSGKGNPFSLMSEAKVEAKVDTFERQDVEESATQDAQIGFPQRSLKTPSMMSAQSSKFVAERASMAVQSTMMDAREGLAKNKGFMGALNFLNSQAAISLIKTRADKFEVMA